MTPFFKKAYRDVTIIERGRPKKVSMIEANIRALAVSGAKGNNRAANIFTTAVLKIEEENKNSANWETSLVSSQIGSLFFAGLCVVCLLPAIPNVV